VDVPISLVEVTRAREESATMEAARITVAPAIEVPAQEDAEAMKKVWKVEAKNAMAFTSAREDAKGLAWKIALLEGQLRRSAMAERWPRRIPAIYLKWRPMVSISGMCLRESARSNLRS
jgi:hypothetical protein